jgi:hypothetical protein
VAACHSPALFKELHGVQLIFHKHLGFAVHKSEPDAALDVASSSATRTATILSLLSDLLNSSKLAD